METIFRDGLFGNDVVLVTGGGTGIGLATARELGALGARVALCGRRTEPLELAAAAMRRDEMDVFFATCDIREADQVNELVQKVVAHYGRLDVLINNAGGQFPIAAEDLSPRGFEAVVRNNLLGTWNVTHAVANACFIPQKRGRIVNIIANIARGFPGMVHTGAARAGVENLTKTLSVEWVQHGIRVNAVAPGVVKTSGTDQYPPELLDSVTRTIPLRRTGNAQEVAHLITYLASKQADYITGQTFYIDGGHSLHGSGYPVPDEVPQFPPE